MKSSSTKTFHYSRRTFIGVAAASAFFSFQFLPSRVFGANERLQVAGIGVGGKGKGDFDGLAMHGDVVAACDIDPPVVWMSRFENMWMQLNSATLGKC